MFGQLAQFPSSRECHCTDKIYVFIIIFLRTLEAVGLISGALVPFCDLGNLIFISRHDVTEKSHAA
jgi:hypothetical protein